MPASVSGVKRYLVIVPILLLFLTPGCGNKTATFDETIAVSLGSTNSVSGAPAIIALEKGFFADEGLTVDLQLSSDSPAVMENLASGDIDTAIVVEVTLVSAAFADDTLRIVATTSISDNDAMVIARRSSGINKPEDIKNKKVGAIAENSTHYYLYLFMLKNGMTINDIDLYFSQPDELIDMLASGRLDAVSLFGTYLPLARKALDGDAILFSNPGLYRKIFSLISTESYITGNSIAIERMLAAIIKAEEYISAFPEESMKTTADHLGLELTEVREVWEHYDFRVALDQSLLMAYETEAQWMIRIGWRNQDELPDFYSLFYFETLSELDKNRVTVIH